MIGIKYEYRKYRDKFVCWLAYKLPARLVYWCNVRTICVATSGEYSDTIVNEVSAMEVMKRFGDHYNVE